MRLLVLGANSDMAHATAREFARKANADVILASRDLDLLSGKARDFRVRYEVSAEAVAFDALEYESHADFYHRLDPKPDAVLLAFGHLGDQETAQADFESARRIIDTNFSGAVSILEVIAADFSRRRQGLIIAIGSVAGDRGRQSNYIYGAAKGALQIYLSGLRNRLSRHRVRVITVLPGFVHTKMTAGLGLPPLLTATPSQVAADIWRAYAKSRDVVYTRWFWRWIMALIKAIPEPIFKRLSL